MQKRVGAKIAHLVREGKTSKQAAGEAYGMARAHRLGPGGQYKRVSK
jgi:hypothetical protein